MHLHLVITAVGSMLSLLSVLAPKPPSQLQPLDHHQPITVEVEVRRVAFNTEKSRYNGLLYLPKRAIEARFWSDDLPKEFVAGSAWTIVARGVPPDEGSSFDLWAFAIAADASSLEYRGVCVEIQDGCSLLTWWYRQRWLLAEHWMVSCHNPDGCGMMRAVLLGDASHVVKQHWDVFERTGTIHLLVVSGIHVGFLSAAFAWLCGLGLVPLFRYSRFLPSRRSIQAAAAIVAAWSYCALAGMGVSVVRAAILTSLGALAWWVGRGLPLFSSLVLVGSILVLLKPEKVTAPGMWLSLFCVFALLSDRLGSRYELSHRWRGLREVVTAQWRILLVTIPLVAWFGLRLSPPGVLINFLAIPWVGWVVLPLSAISLLLFLAEFSQLHSIFVNLASWAAATLYQQLLWATEQGVNAYSISFSASTFMISAVLAFFALAAPLKLARYSSGLALLGITLISHSGG